MVMNSHYPPRRVKGEVASNRPASDCFPTPPLAERQHKSSTRRRDYLNEQQAEYFISLSVDRHGCARFHSSPCLRQHEEYIMEPAYQRLQEVLSKLSLSLRSLPKADMTALQVMPPAVANFMAPEDHTGNISYAFQQRRPKRRRSSTIAAGRNSGSENEHARDARSVLPKTRKTIEILAGDKIAMEKWYKNAFHAVQQVSCRLVAKLWIKRIHLKKQSTHPYNGNFPKTVPRDPQRTKPYYWPHTVRHKEPDHITRDERVSVLMNVIQLSPLEEINSPDERQHFINARNLLEALEERRSDIPEEKWEILEEIAKARTLQEQCDRNEIDPETVVELIDCSPDTRRAQGELDDDLDDRDPALIATHVEVEAEIGQSTEEDPSVTPVSSHMASPLDQTRRGSDHTAPMESSSNSMGFQEMFDPESIKSETASDLTGPYPVPQESLPDCGGVSQELSPAVKPPRELFEHENFPATGVSDSQSQHSVAAMTEARKQRHHTQPLHQWPVSIPPELFGQNYASNAAFQTIAMPIDDPMGFQQVQYHHNPAPRRHNIIHGLTYAGSHHYHPPLIIPDSSGPLPMRPASDLRQNLSSQELEMDSNPNQFYY